MIDRFYSAMAERGYAASNWVLGSGGGLLQKFDRDTQKFAIKASYGEKELPSGVTVGFPVQKDPITSKGKKSKAGKLKLIKNHLSGEFTTYSSEDMDNTKFEQLQDEMEVVFENGVLVRFQKFDDIRNLAKQSFVEVLNKELQTV
jgi:nicotinamide phosphoribosyltransferase